MVTGNPRFRFNMGKGDRSLYNEGISNVFYGNRILALKNLNGKASAWIAVDWVSNPLPEKIVFNFI